MPREELPCHVLFVGAGPANLAGALHLARLVAAHNEAVANGSAEGPSIDEPMIAVIEKGNAVGMHQLSGAVMDPRALDELVPDWRDRSDFPLERWAEREALWFLTPDGHVDAPWIAPELHNVGKPIVSLGRLCAWLAGLCEEAGVNVFPGFAGVDLLWEGDQVVGVRTGDKGVGKDGQPKGAFEPGMDLRALVTVFGEGPRGHLARKLIQRRMLDADANPMAYELGVKEVLELPAGRVQDGFVAHMIGWPLDRDVFGGAFLYTLGGDRACIGLMVALDAAPPDLDVHRELQRLKTHPSIRAILEGGKVVSYGAKAVTIGGWSSVPRLATDGAVIVGDSASFLNPMRVKGIHLSMKSGMLAAEAAFEALKSGDASASTLMAYDTAVRNSWIRQDMAPATNMHAHFATHGFVGGLVRTGVDYFFGAGKVRKTSPDHAHMATMAQRAPMAPPPAYDGTYLLDKLTDVYHSGTKHDEQQPAHLKILDPEICATTCAETYGNPCTRFCPAQVYNMRPDPADGRLRIEVDFANCVHCKTCDIRDPYQIITWVPPEGGQGPEYATM